jgi:hypothetical protein
MVVLVGGERPRRGVDGHVVVVVVDSRDVREGGVGAPRPLPAPNWGENKASMPAKVDPNLVNWGLNELNKMHIRKLNTIIMLQDAQCVRYNCCT